MTAAGSTIAPVAKMEVGAGVVRPTSSLYIAVLALAVAVASYIAATLGHAIVLSTHGVSVLWPACALLVSVLLLVPRRTWPVLIPAGLAGFAVHDSQFGFAPGTIALLNLADTIEILIVCLGLGYSFNGIPRLNSWRALAKYCFFAVFLGPFVSAFVVPLAIPGSYAINWRIWFFSQTLAFLTVTPAILAWATAYFESGFRGARRLRLEALALIGGLAVLGYFVLLGPWKAFPTVLLYSFVPFLLWAALRFGSFGVSTSMIVISFLSIWGAIHGYGPFASPEPFNSVLSLQLFLMFAAVPFMTLSVMAEERERHLEALSNVSRRLIEAQEEERLWIARELHDDFNQRVAMVSIDLESLRRSLAGSEPHARTAGDINKRINELSTDIHALAHRLHSSNLEHLGLVAACKGFCQELAERHSVEITFHAGKIQANLPREIALCLFRVLQEALQNAVKHSGARTCQVSLTSAAGEIELCVHDSGTGFDPEQALGGHGLGLTSMNERMKLIDGQLGIDSSPGEGTTVRACVSPGQRTVAYPASKPSSPG
jgi:signal transduction histidine kinase